MRRIKIIGLALVAAFALSAFAASAASAALPEFVSGNGKFPIKVTFTSGSGVLESANGKRVECTLDSGAGEVVNAKLIDKVIIKFTGCTTISGGLRVKCTTGAEPEGTIVTKEISAKLVYDNVAKTTVALLAANEKEGAAGLYTEFKCTALQTIKVKGSTLILILGPLNTATRLLQTSTRLSSTKGKPEDVSYWNESNTELLTAKMETKGEGVENFGYEESGALGNGDILVAGSEPTLEVKA